VRFIPEWFPFVTFHTEAKVMREDLERLYDVPFGFVKEEMVRTHPLPMFIVSFSQIARLMLT
jgi:aromatic ring-cleaving dioxygenase